MKVTAILLSISFGHLQATEQAENTTLTYLKVAVANTLANSYALSHLASHWSPVCIHLMYLSPIFSLFSRDARYYRHVIGIG